MSSEVQKYIEKALDKNKNLFNAEVISFPKDKKIDNFKKVENNERKLWKLYDKSNSDEDGDQLKAVIGICFMLSVLIIVGLYSNLA